MCFWELIAGMAEQKVKQRRWQLTALPPITSATEENVGNLLLTDEKSECKE